MSDNDAIADTLDAAADLIERNGWFRGGTAVSHRGGGCAYTAIVRAGHYGEQLCSPAIAALRRYIPGRSIFAWNDSFDNPQPVLDAMRKCAKELRMMEVDG